MQFPYLANGRYTFFLILVVFLSNLTYVVWNKGTSDNCAQDFF